MPKQVKLASLHLHVHSDMSLHAGRVQTILLFKIIGVNLMGFMGLHPEIWTKLGIIIPVYVVRTAIINSAYPLQKSILMDYVPKVSTGTCLSSLHVSTVQCMVSDELSF